MARASGTALPAGTYIDTFEIRSVIGAGGFGITYLAMDHHLKRAVALKEFFPHRLATRSGDGTTLRARTQRGEKYFHAARSAFLAEARALAQFRHPSIVRVSRHLEAHGTAYIAMEYERGETLHAFLRREGALDDEATRALFAPLLDGLAEMHERNFVHGDIKPANVIIRNGGDPVLIDFGAVRGEAGWSRMASWHTYTPGFSSPEQQVDVQEQGAWSDLYSVGALLFNCITGKQPPAATERVFARYFGRVDPLDVAMSSLRKNLGPEYLHALDVIASSMALAYKQRPANVNEFVAIWNGEREGIAQAMETRRLIDPDPTPDRPAVVTAPVAPMMPTFVTIPVPVRQMVLGHLAEHIDEPRAERLVSTLHDQCTSNQDFYHRLAEHIDGEARREEFIAAVTLGEYLH